MKIVILLLTFLTGSLHAATCTTTSRNNYSANQVLTSSALNADFNQLVTKVNAFDGGCVSSGSLEFDALNTTQFQPVLKGIKAGCKISKSNDSTISISKCLASVNGSFVYTSSATTVSFGCTGCSSPEGNDQAYYVYIQNGSSGTTLTPLILATAPNEDGYDSSNNLVLGKFYNNADGNINTWSLRQWNGNSFTPAETEYAAYITAAGTVSSENTDWLSGNCAVTDTSLFTCTFNNRYFTVAPSCSAVLVSNGTASDQILKFDSAISVTQMTIRTSASNDATAFTKTAYPFYLKCSRMGADYTYAKD